ncbi:MAG: hypothetical protein ACI93R_004094 [Flavobacteriales bacterium]|jgi:hypothetical protein
MSKSLKAFIFSALIFPGAGHFVLKRYKTAAAITLATLVIFCILMAYAVQRALGIMDDILDGKLDPINLSFTQVYELSTGGAEPQYITYSSGVLALLWLISLVDIYRIDRLERLDGTHL